MRALLEAISPNGVILRISGANDPDEADAIVRMVEKATVDALKARP